MWMPGRPRAPEEVVYRVANFAWTLHIGEVPAVVESDQLGVRNCPRDMRGDLGGDEVVIAPDN